MIHPIGRALVQAILSAVIPITVQAQNCAAFATVGWYDRVSLTSQVSRWMQFLRYIRSEQVSTFDKANKLAVDAAIPIGELVAPLGVSWNSRGYEQLRSMSEDFFQQRILNSQTLNALAETVNPTVVNALEKCLKAHGLHSWAETSTSGNHVVIVGDYVASPGMATASVNLRTPKGLKCDRNKYKIEGGQKFPILCERSPELEGDFLVTVRTKALQPEGTVIWIPPIPDTAKPPLPHVEVLITAVDDYVSVTLNGKQVAIAHFGQQGGWTHVTDALLPGDNTFRITVTNYGGPCQGRITVRVNGQERPDLAWGAINTSPNAPRNCLSTTRVLRLP